MLAPYVVPFYLGVLALAALGTRLAAGGVPCVPAWLAAAGFLWGFHACFTLDALFVRQPDVMEFGRVFSWTLIAFANALFLALALAAVSSVPLAGPLAAGADAAARLYVRYADLAAGVLRLVFA